MAPAERGSSCLRALAADSGRHLQATEVWEVSFFFFSSFLHKGRHSLALGGVSPADPWRGRRLGG